MKFTIEIPDIQFDEVVTAVSTRRGWTPTVKIRNDDGEVSEIPNPQSREDVFTEATLTFWADEATAERVAKAPPVPRVKFDQIKD